MAMRVEKLKNCPFCGTKPEISCYGGIIHIIACPKCEAVHPGVESRVEAIKRWNTRADSYTPSDPKADYEKGGE